MSTHTQGVRYVAKTGRAYWLIDEIAFAQAEAAVKAEPFQHWILSMEPDKTARLHCTDGNDHEVLTKVIDYTDFPMDQIAFHLTDTVLLLPSEY